MFFCFLLKTGEQLQMKMTFFLLVYFTRMISFILFKKTATDHMPTSETINIMTAGRFWETCLVAEAVDGLDTGLWAPTPVSRCSDGVAHAAVRQPAGTAVVQSFTPCQVQLCSRR